MAKVIELASEALTSLIDSYNSQVKSLITPVYNVKGYGAKGDGVTDDTVAIQAAIDAARTDGGGLVYFPTPTISYLAGNLVGYGNIAYIGDVWNAKLKKKSGAKYLFSINPYAGGTPDPANNEKSILFRGLCFEGRSVEDGFIEQNHLLNLNAVSDCVVEKCKFMAPEGDCIYLGSSNQFATERHNERVVIKDCYFDGVNYSNRNGISIIDGVDIVIKDNYFTRLTYTGMPGPIDVEPNGDTFARIKDIVISGNVLDNNHGTLGIGIYLANSDQYVIPTQNIFIRDNVIKDTNTFGSGAPAILVRFFNATTPFAVTESTVYNNIQITGNTIHKYAVAIEGVRGINITKNSFLSCSIVMVGDITGSSAKNCIDVEVIDNIFDKSGNSYGQLVFGNVKSVLVDSNIFRDPNPGPDNHYAINFFCDGTEGASTSSEYISILNNIFQGTIANIIHAFNHNFNRWTNHFRDNNFPTGVGNIFQWNGDAAPVGVTSFLNSWTGTDVSYYKDNEGIVHLQGSLSGGTLNFTAFILPSGYWPSVTQVFAITSNDAFGQAAVGSDGSVKPRIGSTTNASLNGISFRAV